MIRTGSVLAVVVTLGLSASAEISHILKCAHEVCPSEYPTNENPGGQLSSSCPNTYVPATHPVFQGLAPVAVIQDTTAAACLAAFAASAPNPSGSQPPANLGAAIYDLTGSCTIFSNVPSYTGDDLTSFYFDADQFFVPGAETFFMGSNVLEWDHKRCIPQTAQSPIPLQPPVQEKTLKCAHNYCPILYTNPSATDFFFWTCPDTFIPQDNPFMGSRFVEDFTQPYASDPGTTDLRLLDCAYKMNVFGISGKVATYLARNGACVIFGNSASSPFLNYDFSDASYYSSCATTSFWEDPQNGIFFDAAPDCVAKGLPSCSSDAGVDANSKTIANSSYPARGNYSYHHYGSVPRRPKGGPSRHPSKNPLNRGDPEGSYGYGSYGGYPPYY